MEIFKTIVFILFGILFINAGLDKFLHYLSMPYLKGDLKKSFEVLATLKWIIPLVGLVEFFSGVLVLFPKTRTLGSLMVFPIVMGIICHNAIFMPEGLVMASALLLINLWIMIDHWAKIKPIFN